MGIDTRVLFYLAHRGCYAQRRTDTDTFLYVSLSIHSKDSF